MRRLAGFCMTVAVLALALGCGKKDSTESGGGGSGTTGTTSTGIEGNYTVVSLEVDGKDFTDLAFPKGKDEERTLKITGDKLITTKEGKEDTATYKVDSAKNPKEIDITAHKTVSTSPPMKGPKGKAAEKDKGKTVEEKTYGIYKVEGDKLIICLAEGKAEDRPKDFKTAGTKGAMMTLKKK